MKVFVLMVVCALTFGCKAMINIPANEYLLQSRFDDTAELLVDAGPVKANFSVDIYGWQWVKALVSGAVDEVMGAVKKLTNDSPV